MNWMYKLERKLGKYKIYDLHKYLVFIYLAGVALTYITDGLIVGYIMFDIDRILQGEVWRIFSWVLYSRDTGLFSIIFMLCLIPMGRTLEQFLGTFRMNVYLLGGIIINIVGAALVYLISWLLTGNGLPVILTMYYILLTTFMALAICVPDATVNLYFILPIKMKWLLIVYVLELFYEISQYYSAGAKLGVMMGILMVTVMGSQIIFALLNLGLFFFFSKVRPTRKQKKRQKEYRAQMKITPFPANGGARHKCAICGRTEKDAPNMVFRYCSKCTNNKEYCEEHLFTHTHN